VALSTTSSPTILCFTVDGSIPKCTYDEVPPPACVDASPPHLPAVACATGTSTYEAGSPVHVSAPLDGGSITIGAKVCSTGNLSPDVTYATYTFPPP
jgi:hypothetical protein